MSSLYRAEPLGERPQPWYINAVAELETSDAPASLLRRLQGLERRAGRWPGGERWAPRVLDLDLLLVGHQVLESPGLVLPHPAFQRRRFVLKPLVELTPEVRDPRSGLSARQLLAALDDPLRVEKLERAKIVGRGLGSSAGRSRVCLEVSKL